jgi:hypothetical protein
MWRPWTPSRLTADMLSLQMSAERAGSAWACSFSSSDEFEAAIVRSRRDAGVYGPKRHRRTMVCAGVAIAAFAALLLLLLL